MKIVEVAPRDGLQNEKSAVPTAEKIAFVDALGKTGVAEIEITSFVSPRWVPQLSDAEDVFAGITRSPGVVYSALVPNEKGMDRAEASGADKISVFTAASQTFNRFNINATTEESIERFRPVIRRSTVPVRGYVSTAIWCPYEERVAPRAVLDVMERLVDLGVNELSIADTVGKASPDEVRRLLDVILPCDVPVALHFHDTYGMAVANAFTAWGEYGIDTFDSSAGALGGCPYATGATGNIATEDLVFALTASGVQTGVDLDAVVEAAKVIEPYLGRSIGSHLGMVKRGAPPDGDGGRGTGRPT